MDNSEELATFGTWVSNYSSQLSLIEPTSVEVCLWNVIPDPDYR